MLEAKVAQKAFAAKLFGQISSQHFEGKADLNLQVVVQENQRLSLVKHNYVVGESLAFVKLMNSVQKFDLGGRRDDLRNGVDVVGDHLERILQDE